MQLYIGNKNYSTWSIRAWLLTNKYNLSFEEIKLTLDTKLFYDRLQNISPTLKVPTLVDGSTAV